MSLRENSQEALLSQLSESIRTVYGLPDCRTVSKEMYCNLSRRIKLLRPLFEELRDSEEELQDDVVRGLELLGIALNSALELLKSVHEGSKILQALQLEQISEKFHHITCQIEEALSHVSYTTLDMTEEVKEQIELVHTHFKRAKEIVEPPDLQLEMDLAIAQRERNPDPAILNRISEKLHLRTLNDLKRESLAIHDLIIAHGGFPEHFEIMSSLFKKIKDSVMMENPNFDAPEGDKSFVRHRSPVIPDDFRCPISLELMKDPVIVSTGQTYERSCVQKWLDAGHKTCPKTQQTLMHTALTPNYVLKSLIAFWCESNGVEVPKRQGNCRNKKPGVGASDCDPAAIDALLQKLTNGNPEEQRAAAGELRLLAKRNADNRVYVAEAGAIPLLVELLSSPDSRTQEHAVTALLNLSINDANKVTIVNAGAIPDIVDVLRIGSMEARENAAATLFSLSVVDENKIAIGAAGAIPALIDLLCHGTPRGKKDAATAIFNLSIYQGNKVRAVRSGIVPPLIRLLKDPGGGMMDEALAILAILASHLEGKAAIGHADPIPAVVEVIRTSSPRNRENAAAILWSLCTGNVQYLKLAKDLGAEEALKELSEGGTDRAKRKATSVLELLQQVEVEVMSIIGDNTNTTAENDIPNPSDSNVSEARGKKRSWVWDHFVKQNDQNASCNYCDAVLTCRTKNGTNALGNHLGRCKKYPYNVEKKQKTLKVSKEGGDGKIVPMHMFDQERCRKSLARMIVVDELPFKFVEREGFRLFCQDMQPRFLIPSRSSVARDCYSLYLDEKKKLKNFFSKLSSRVCLTTNSWTSIQNLNYMCLAAHFIDDDWTLHRKIINFCPITSTSEVIGQSVERCLLDWGINKILTITVDNANYNNKGLAYLKRRLNSWEGTVLNGDFLHMRCAAHILSLTVREGLKELDDAVVRIRSAIKYVRSSPARAQKFKFCVEKERIESKSLPYLDVETRWNSTYLMLESAVKFQKAFELLETVDQNYVDELTPIIRVDRDLEEEDTKSMSDGRNSRIRGLPTEFDWEYVRNLLPFLKVFYDTTMRLSSSLYTTGNQYMIEIYAIGFLLTRLIEGKDVGASVMASKMKKKHDEYWANVDKFNMLLFIAVVLDPRYKLKYVLWVIEQTYSAANSELLKEKVKSILKNLFDSYKISLSPKVLVPQSEEVSMREVDTFVGGAVDYMNSMYFDMEDDSESTQNKTELDIYLLEIRVDRNDPTFNILEFWKSNSARYPVLSMMARDVLAIPASTVASELAFSTGGCVLDPFRSSLTPRMVEALICAQDWLRTAHGPLYLEEHLEDLEKIESEVSCLGEEQPVINLQDD